ncbi:hypothetical protein AMECASPLE_018997 [Ameca splendens]|uniref:Secreted protein n=1 Tax=Ameca splendens TaxID=208324 RepID=A0ABV0YPY8_9TELE
MFQRSSLLSYPLCSRILCSSLLNSTLGFPNLLTKGHPFLSVDLLRRFSVGFLAPWSTSRQGSLWVLHSFRSVSRQGSPCFLVGLQTFCAISTTAGLHCSSGELDLGTPDVLKSHFFVTINKILTSYWLDI